MKYTLSPMAAILNLNGTNDLCGSVKLLQTNLKALASTITLPRVKLNITEADEIPPSNLMVVNDFITEMRNDGIDVLLDMQPQVF